MSPPASTIPRPPKPDPAQPDHFNLKPRRIVIAGGTGFLGKRLAPALAERGDHPVLLTRTPRADIPWPQAQWDGASLGPWTAQLEGAAALINLTGRNVNCRPLKTNRREILRSRVDSVRVLGQALKVVQNPPPVWIQASSLAIYGDGGDRVCVEDSPASDAWPANVCTAWESAFAEVLPTGTRGVVLRIGFVLSREGGALPFLDGLVRWGLGGTIGSGKQGISWLHAADMDRIFLAAIDDTCFSGVFNITAPDPRSNRDFMRRLRHAAGRPWSPPAPAWAVHLGAWLLGSDPVIALTGRYCMPARLEALGFDFAYSRLEDALTELYANAGKPASQ